MGAILIRWAFAALAVSIWAAPARAYEVGVFPGDATVRVAPGEATLFSIEVRNPGGSPLDVSIYPWDLWWVPDEGVAPFPPGTQPRSAAGWIEATPSEVQVAPQSTLEVPVNVNVPTDAEGGYYAMLFVQTKLVDPDASVVEAATAARVGVQVRIEIEGTGRPAIEVVDMGHVPSGGVGNSRIVVRAKNTGNVHVPLTGKVVVRRADDGATVLTLATEGTRYCLPEQTCRLRLPWAGALAPGRYTVAAAITYGPERVMAGAWPLEVLAAPPGPGATAPGVATEGSDPVGGADGE